MLQHDILPQMKDSLIRFYTYYQTFALNKA